MMFGPETMLAGLREMATKDDAEIAKGVGEAIAKLREVVPPPVYESMLNAVREVHTTLANEEAAQLFIKNLRRGCAAIVAATTEFKA